MKIGFFGTGLMGRPMAARLIKLGYTVVVYNRTREKALPLEELGAIVAMSSQDAISQVDCIILMLSDAQAIQQVLFSLSRSLTLGARTIIQMGTISPSQSMQLNDLVDIVGGQYFEAPVLGSIAEAEAGNLQVMFGGSAEQFTEWLPMLQCFGRQPLHVGEVGKAAALKLALNQLIASMTASFCLSMAYVQRQGLDVEMFMNILRQSALYAPTFDKKLPRYLSQDYANGNFPTKHLVKDIKLFLDEAQAAQLNTVVLEAVYKLALATNQSGFADSDYAAIFELVKQQVK